MRLAWYPAHRFVDLSGASAEELQRLGRAVAAGEGAVGAEPPARGIPLAGAEVRAAPGPGVLIAVDEARRVLVIRGGAAARAVLADNLRGMAAAQDGGHMHVEYFPDHPYLADGSVPMVVTSPHGPMPRR